jgi:pimeloyl-ACP methyl ester carboxylesterase
MQGELWRFKAEGWPAPLQAFESPNAHKHRRFCIYVGGLTDGLLACPYVEALGSALDERGWALIQPVLSSAYAGYGCSSLERDADELAELLSHVSRRVDGKCEFAIIGHSTGCQDAVTLLARAPPALRARVRACVLQAPVSDREAASLDEYQAQAAALLAEAQALCAAGEPNKLLSARHYGFVPLTAGRYASFFSGADDMFSSDLTDAELAAKLGHMGTRGQREGSGAALAPAPEHPGLHCTFVHSGSDEYVPSAVDVAALSSRFVAAAGGADNGASAVTIAGASHNVGSPDGTAAAEFVACACAALERSVRATA